jgi:hypothetical protein
MSFKILVTTYQTVWYQVSYNTPHFVLSNEKKLKITHQEAYKTLATNFEVSKAMKIHTVVLWVMTMCSQVGSTNISKKYTPPTSG